jgi:hypothetical protein
VTVLTVAGLASALPGRSVGADSETFLTAGVSPCPIAHCNQQLDGREGLSIPVGTAPTAYATYTPSPAIAFSTGLACTTGAPSLGSGPSAVECSGTQPSNAGSSAGPFLYNLSATGSGSSTTLSLTWKSASYTGPPTLPCQFGTAFAVDQYVEYGAPLFSDYGYTYVSDD